MELKTDKLLERLKALMADESVNGVHITFSKTGTMAILVYEQRVCLDCVKCPRVNDYPDCIKWVKPTFEEVMLS